MATKQPTSPPYKNPTTVRIDFTFEAFGPSAVKGVNQCVDSFDTQDYSEIIQAIDRARENGWKKVVTKRTVVNEFLIDEEGHCPTSPPPPRKR